MIFLHIISTNIIEVGKRIYAEIKTADFLGMPMFFLEEDVNARDSSA